MAKPPRPTAKVAAAQTELPANLRLTRLYLGTACFLAGAAMMVIEICAYRLLAPLFGNSVYTWTALIGVILIAFSAGGYLGGRLADRKAGLEVLAWLLGGASILTFFIPILHAWFGESFVGGGFIGGSILISIFLFAVPGALLGAVSPAAVRFYSLTLADTHVGVAAGTISMLGSLGSFVGTFLSGFVLLAYLGVRSIFIGAGVVLLLLALVAFLLDRKALAGKVAAVLAISLGSGVLASMVKYRPQVEGIVLHEEESFYHHIEVSERGESPYKQRLLRLDSTNEGGMNPDDGSLVFPYQQFWQVVKFKEDFKIQNALFMGAGAFGMPEILSGQYPQASIDVAEIDPKVIDAGHRYFKLGEFPQVHAHAEDARHFLRSRPRQRWDLIFGDAYNGVRAIPSHLLTQEFFQLVSDRLTPDGVFVMNVITALRGPQSELLAGILKTLRTVYPHVEVFDVEGLNGRPSSGHQAQNVILLASRQDWRPYFKERYFASGSMEKRIAETLVAPQELPQSGILFTDNYNPVDAIIARGLIQ